MCQFVVDARPWPWEGQAQASGSVDGCQPQASHHMGLLLPRTWDGLVLLVGSMVVPSGAFGGHQASPRWIPGKRMGIGFVGTSLSHSVVS